MNASPHDPAHREKLPPLVLGAMGVVFGDIGTSPLYTMKEVFAGPHPLTSDVNNVLGILSLILWSLLLVVTLKYVLFVMRADNQGEGGIMAMLALVQRAIPRGHRLRWLLLLLGIFGAALFYGDGIITPAISVLSAVEGLEVATPFFTPAVPYIALIILLALFVLQRAGTARVGFLFGPVMLLWFATLAVLGVINIAHNPVVLQAVSPHYAIHFFVENRVAGFLSLGAVVLAVTGAEALYADMGHFGKPPIRYAWFFAVFPALLLNYFGQGALILTHPETEDNPFFHMISPELVIFLVILATMATIIASQAVITGAFSVTRQAIQLGYLPRMAIRHTSSRAEGQIYIPFINWALLISIVLLVLGFRDSTHLASAYGIAVTGAMVIDTILGFFVVVFLWRWNRWIALTGLLLFLSIDLAFFSANAVKIPHGGWFPLLVGLFVFLLLYAWKYGREKLASRMHSDTIQLEPFLAGLMHHPPQRIPGTAVFLNANPDSVPRSLLHNLAHNKVLHERLIFLTVLTRNIPYVPDEEKFEVKSLGDNAYRLVLYYGFMEAPDVPKALYQSGICSAETSQLEISYFLSRETLVVSHANRPSTWREHLFVWMMRNSQTAMSFFNIPVNRVIELGAQVDL